LALRREERGDEGCKDKWHEGGVRMVGKGFGLLGLGT